MVLECVGAIDQGTQSTRFTLYDYSARIIAKFQVDIVQHRLQAGCVTAGCERSSVDPCAN